MNEDVKTENATEEEAPSVKHAWVLIAYATAEEFDDALHAFDDLEEDLSPSIAMLRDFTEKIKNAATPFRPRKKVTLPNLDQNFWDDEAKTLLCYDEKMHVAELWKRQVVD